MMGLDVFDLEYGDLESGDLESRSRKRNHGIPYNHAPTQPLPSTHPIPQLQRDLRSFENNSRYPFSIFEKDVFEINDFYHYYIIFQ